MFKLFFLLIFDGGVVLGGGGGLGGGGHAVRRRRWSSGRGYRSYRSLISVSSDLVVGKRCSVTGSSNINLLRPTTKLTYENLKKDFHSQLSSNVKYFFSKRYKKYFFRPQYFIFLNMLLYTILVIYHECLIMCIISIVYVCLLYTSPSPRDRQKSRMPSSA